MSSRCSRGSSSSARAIIRCCSLWRARDSGLSPAMSGTAADSNGSQPDAVGAQTIDGAISRKSNEPGNRRSKRRVVGLSARPYQHERFLQHFVGFVPVAENSEDQTIQQAAMPIVQLPNRVGISRDDTVD